MELREYPIPELGDTDVLIKMKACAICTVEQRNYSGVTKRYPGSGGHEGAGVVAAVGKKVGAVQVGDHVIINRESCGYCHNCKLGEWPCLTQWANRAKAAASGSKPTVRPGLMAQYAVRKEKDLTQISQATPFVQAAIAEPVSCVVRSVKRSRLTMGESVVIIGAGIMGLLHVQLAKLNGGYVIVSETDVRRRELAVQAGADVVFSPMETEDPAAFVRELTGGRGVDVVFNTVAISSVFEQGMSFLMPTGRIVAYSSQHPDTPVPIKMGQLHSQQYEIIGTIGSTTEDFYRAVQLIETGRVNLDLVIDSTVPLERCKEAFERATVPGTYRVVLTMDD